MATGRVKPGLGDETCGAILREAHEAKLAGVKNMAPYVARYAAAAKVSRVTAYEAFGALVAKRKPRSDKGKSKLSDDHALLVAREQLVTQRKKRGKLKSPLSHCKEDLDKMGALPPVSISTVRRRLAELGYDPSHRDTDRPYIQLSDYGPGDVIEVDASQPVFWYLREKGGFKLNLAKEHYEYKPGKQRLGALIRYLVVDHCTGAIWLHYAQAAGERATDFARSCWEAFAYKGDEFPFGGLPRLIYADPGAGLTAELFKSVWEPLGVQIKPHMPGHARATGSAEGSMPVGERFELSLMRRGLAEFDNVDDLNELAYEFCRERNETRYFARLKGTRFAAWRRWLVEHPATYPPAWDVIERMMTGRVHTRTIERGYLIRYNTRGYMLSSLMHYRECQKGQKIAFIENPYDPLEIYVLTHDGQRHLIRPEVLDEFGRPLSAPKLGVEFKSLPDDMATTARKRALALTPPPSPSGARVISISDANGQMAQGRDGIMTAAPRLLISREEWWTAYHEAWEVAPAIVKQIFRARYGEAEEGFADEVGVAWHEDAEMMTKVKPIKFSGGKDA